jgi:competence protein ComEC
MSLIHFLNVADGDCTLVEHESGRITVIDVSKARPPKPLAEAVLAKTASIDRGVNGDFHQRQYPVNPISYLKSRGVTSIFRYVQTHPDMDHMDGIKDLFAAFEPANFWDTANKKRMAPSSWDASLYRREDWEFYVSLRDGEPRSDPRRLTLLSGARGEYYNTDSGEPGGDGLHVLAPSQQLVDAANGSGDFNDCSYVILYRTGGNRIIFAGDSHDDTWKHVVEHHTQDVADVDLLVAPHHGRDSRRSFGFLDVINPALTLFGIAPSRDLAYSAWRDRDLPIITNNQANCIVVDAGTAPMELYATHERFARAKNPRTRFSERLDAWYVGPIGR